MEFAGGTQMRKVLCLLASFAFGPVNLLAAQGVTLDFDSVTLPPATCTDASPYLASFGITFVSVSGGASGAICNQIGTSATPSSPPNVFYGQPAITNTDESFDLVFSTALANLRFTRATVLSSN